MFSNRVIIFVLSLFSLIAPPAISGSFSIINTVGGGILGIAPVVTNATFNPSTPAANAQTVGTVAATNSPTSWSITAGDAAGDFAISNAGVITFTAQGATDYPGTKNLNSATLTVRATNASGSGSGVVDINGYADGSVNAPAGTPQHPTLLNGYAVRAPWKVAGDDYYVGLPSGTSLSDPASISVTGAVYSSTAHTVTLNTAGVTVSGYDFALHGGTQIQVKAANVIIKNNNFGMSANGLDAIVVLTGGNNVYIGYNTIDQGGTVQLDAALYFSGTSSGATIEYNWIKNCGADAINFAQGTYIVRYNLIENIGQLAGTHPDFAQTSGPASAPITAQTYFNTWLNPSAAIVVAAQGTIIGDNSSLVVGAASLDYNTLIASGTSQAVSYWVRVFSPNLDAAATVSVQHNFADISQAFDFAYPGSNHTQTTWATNTNMVTGGAFSNAP